MDDELLNSNPFSLEKPTNTYGVQKELRKQALKAHLNQDVQILAEPTDEEILDGDLMVTNPATKNNPVLEAKLDKSRYVKEIRSFYNIDSRNRQMFEERCVPKDPITCAYTREIINADGEVSIEKYSADDLNLEVEDGEIMDPFFERNDEIFFRDAKNFEPNNYEIVFQKTLNNVKTIRMISSEIPNPMTTINNWNNLILIDIRNEDIKLTDRQKSLGLSNSIPLISPFSLVDQSDFIQSSKSTDRLKDSSLEKESQNLQKQDNTQTHTINCANLPFFIIQIPLGNYDLDGLLQIMEETVNKTIERRSKAHYKDLFIITGNINTGVINIKINPSTGHNLTFHWRFWFSTGIPEQRLLYWMLGFARPFERCSDGCNKYVKEWNNLCTIKATVRNISNCKTVVNQHMNNYLCACGIAQVRPFRKINLMPETYIFLIFEEIGSLIDQSLPEKLYAKIRLTTAPGVVAFDTFVNTPQDFSTTPLRELSKLKVKWIDSNGNLIDWNGLEHSYTLEIIQYIDKLTANDYSSIRGVIDPTSYSSKEIVFAYAQ